MAARSKFFSVVLLIALVFSFFFFWQREKSLDQEISETPVSEPEQSYFPVNQQDDCTNECGNYKNDQERYNYCRAVCGFTVEEGVTSLPASNDPGLAADYQTKEKAVSEKDIAKCGEIKDSNLKKTCQARVTEDTLEAQGGNGF